MTWFDYLKATDILVGLALTIIGVGASVWVWAHQRVKKLVEGAESRMAAAQALTAQRLGTIEDDVTALATKMRETHEDIGVVQGRLTGVERTVEGLPSREDIHQLIVGMTELRASMHGRMDRVEERILPIAAFADRMQEWLLRQGK